jgi:hypothetical protein
VFVLLYRYSFALRIYKFWKWLARLCYGTTEIFRLCHASTIPQPNSVRQSIYSQSKLPDPKLLLRLDNSILHSTKLFRYRIRCLEDPLYPSFQTAIDELIILKFAKPKKILVDKISEPKTSNKMEVYINAYPAEIKVLEILLRPIYDCFVLLHELNKRAASRYDPAVPNNEKKLLAVFTM